MKSIKPLLLFTLSVVCASAGAQRPIVVSEDSVTYGSGKYPGICVLIPEVSFDKTEKNWIKELQGGTRSKVVSENGQMSIFGAYMKDISPNPLNIYSLITNQDSAVLLQASFELKKDQYIEKSNGETEVLAAREYLRQFAKNQYIDFVKDEVQSEDKKLRDLTGDLNSLENEKNRMKKSIQSNRTAITEENNNITLNNTELTTLSSEIALETNQYNNMEVGAAREEKASYLKELEKRQKKIQNDIKSSENKIQKATNEIDQAEKDIPKNESDQESIRKKITDQEAVLQKFTNKLNTVKAY
jgi:chromosome segregation ATPase